MDARGRFYLQVPGWMIDAKARGDSVPVVRFDPATRTVDTVAIVKGSTSPPPRDGRQMGIPFVPFSPQDAWSVARDGRLAVVRSNDYHVEWRSTGGTCWKGEDGRAGLVYAPSTANTCTCSTSSSSRQTP